MDRDENEVAKDSTSPVLTRKLLSRQNISPTGVASLTEDAIAESSKSMCRAFFADRMH